MSLEFFFSVKARLFCLCFEGCLVFWLWDAFCLVVFCGAVLHSLWCASMLVGVRIGMLATLSPTIIGWLQIVCLMKFSLEVLRCLR